MPRTLLLIAVATVCGLSGILAATPESTPPESASPNAASTARSKRVEVANAGETTLRLREGTKLVDQLGAFKVQGDGLTFVSADGTRNFRVLENLAMERISRLVSESPDALEWTVSGTVTECRGANFLLVTQATIKSKPAIARPR